MVLIDCTLQIEDVVAIDDFNHSNDDKCDTLPVEAKPIQTTVSPTPEPTEPPGRTIREVIFL